MYKAPEVVYGAGAVRALRDLPGRVLAISMDLPWQVFQEQCPWSPAQVHMVTDMERSTLEALEATLPACDVVVGVGGGSVCDTAKYLAWKRGCRMVLAPSIVSVDAPFTNMVAVRDQGTVRYIGDLYPEEIIIDHRLIQQAPKDLNRAGPAILPASTRRCTTGSWPTTTGASCTMRASRRNRGSVWRSWTGMPRRCTT